VPPECDALSVLDQEYERCGLFDMHLRVVSGGREFGVAPADARRKIPGERERAAEGGGGQPAERRLHRIDVEESIVRQQALEQRAEGAPEGRSRRIG